MLLALAILLGAPAAIQAAPPPQSPAPASVAPDLPPQAARGRAIYQQNCTRCHGDAGDGKGPLATSGQLQFPPGNFTDAKFTQSRSPDQLWQTISAGRIERLMPPWQNTLSAQEMWDVTSYIWYLSTPAQLVASGKQVYGAQCAACHGPQGNSGNVKLQDLARYKGQTQQQLEATVTNGHKQVTEYKANLSVPDLQAAAAYIRSLSLRPDLSTSAKDGSINVQLVNETPGSSLDQSSPISVTLVALQDSQQVDEISRKADAEGAVHFTSLSRAAGRAYGLQVSYKGVEYFSELLDFSKGDATLAQQVKVYDTTDDAAVIRISRAHLILDFDATNLRVGELYFIDNPGNWTYIGKVPVGGGPRSTLQFSLPAGTNNLKFGDPRMESSTSLTDTGFRDTLPVPPGSRQVLFTYQLPYQSPTMSITRMVPYPTDIVNVLVADVGEKVSVSGLAPQDKLANGSGSSFLAFRTQNFPAAQPFQINLTNLPKTPPVAAAPATAGTTAATTAAALPTSATVLPAGLDQGLIRNSGLALGLVGILLALFYPTLRGRFRLNLQPKALPQTTPGAKLTPGGLQAQRQELLWAVARLDEDFAVGKVPNEEYQHLRAALKLRLVNLAYRSRVEYSRQRERKHVV